MSVIVLSIFYVFWRIKRYVKKHRKQKGYLKNLKGQFDELKEEETKLEGQSVEDKMDGIQFTTNPVFGLARE